MAYFNYFIKCFIRIFTKKYFKYLLLFIIIFIGFILFNNSNVFAANIEQGEYGNYTGFSSSDIATFDNYIEQYKGDYDSFICRTHANADGRPRIYSICFFNEDDFSKIYAYREVHTYEQTYYRLKATNLNNFITSNYGFDSSFNLYNTYTSTNFNPIIGSFNFSVNNSYCLYTNRIIYTDNTYTNVFFNGGDKTIRDISPYFITTDTELQIFDFDYLQINGGTTKYKTTFMGQDYYARFNLKYIYNGVTTNIEILDNYISYNSTDNTWQINIPYNALTNSVVVRNGGVFRYVLEYRLQYVTGYDISTDELTYNLTTEQEQNINQDSDKQLQSQILDATQQTNQSINNLNGSINNLDNSINDSNISDINNNTLPQDNTQDITSNGVNGIFQSIYNAFCVGQPQDIVFPFPFTNQSIVLSPSYVRNALTNSNASFIITLIQAFWWYIISRFIIKDVMDKINKIKSGNIENIEKTNIRGDML